MSLLWGKCIKGETKWCVFVIAKKMGDVPKSTSPNS